MFWIDRLNSGLNRIPIGGGRVEILGWAYDAHLADNRPHRHTYFEACLVGRYGKGVFQEPLGEHSLAPGSLFIARPGVVHNIVNTSKPLMELFWVSFGWSSEEKTPKSDGERAIRSFAESEICAAHDQKALHAMWEALRLTAAGTWSVGSADQTTSLMKAIILGIAQALSPSQRVELPEDMTRPGRLAAAQAVRYVEDNLNRPLSLEEISAHVNISTRQLTRLFTTFAGTSPAQYVRVTRLDRARALLTKTELSIKEIARQVGFTDVQYFTRCFTGHFGVSPGAFRQGERSGRIIQRPGMLL